MALIAKRRPVLAAGGAHSLVVTEMRECIAWGSNSHGQVGNDSMEDVLAPIVIIPRDCRFGFAGRNFSLVVLMNGDLMAWGDNEDGILGIDTGTAKQKKPMKVDTCGLKIKHAAGGMKHLLAVTEDGLLLTWGCNNYGQLGDGTTQKQRKPRVQVLPGGAKAKEVAAGWYHSLVLTEDGQVFGAGSGFGSNAGEQATNRIAGHAGHFVKVIRTGVKQIAAGGCHSMALTKSGTVLAWGNNDQGQIGNGSLEFQPTPVAVCTGQAAIAAGGSHSLCTNDDFQVQVWGHGCIPATEDTISCPARISVCEPTPLQVGKDGGYIMAAGEAHSVFAGPEGNVFAYGRNSCGQVGRGSRHDIGMPLEVIKSGTIEIVSQEDRVEMLMRAPKEDYGPGQQQTSGAIVLREMAYVPHGPRVDSYKGHRGVSAGVPDVLRQVAGVPLSKDLVVHLSRPAVQILSHAPRRKQFHPT
eukprot:TRINITY_DN20971_c0_g1_i2.p1 TRINITY_DN20971_c0_g1~~TRINITY_DN20971_c0_g1_i2.p1  ORF type:complete len:466 (+),score=72.44 TRINITY_DN20971_c0_g1_i2:57-1454(+)